MRTNFSGAVNTGYALVEVFFILTLLTITKKESTGKAFAEIPTNPFTAHCQSRRT